MAPASLVREPVYQQLHDLLHGLAHSSDFAEGARFLTEREVAARFRVSRATANKALANLVASRVLEFRKGIGTFVAPRRIDYDLRGLVSFTRKAADAGVKPSTKVLQFTSLTVDDSPPEVREALGGNGRYRYTERLRIAGERPVILERRYFVARFCPRLRATDLAGSIYQLWADKYHLRLGGAEQMIRAVNMPAADARLLGVRAGAAGLLVESTGRLETGEPLWYEKTLYRGDSYEFHNQLGGIHDSRPAVGRLTGA